MGYRELDHAFGQQMLALRVAIGLTQEELAKSLGVSRHAVGAWEAGRSYPKVQHLMQLIALGVRQRAFPDGREVEAIRELWRAAQQKMFLDEQWLRDLLIQPVSPPVAGAATPSNPRVDWDDALDVLAFYGRTDELAQLAEWLVGAGCRLVSVLGLGGIGKSALAVTAMRRVAPQFDVVIWRSLRDAPPCELLLHDCLQLLAPSALPHLPNELEGRLRLLMEQLRERRVLLVLDNLEVLLEESTGLMRAGFEGYARLLSQAAITAHRSCLLLTSREQPAELVPLEGRHAPVRSLRLTGLDLQSASSVLAEKELLGTDAERERLVECYGGNPLALKIVAQSVVELFGGEIAPFLAQGGLVFGGVRALLNEQFSRLTALEQTLVGWLAILREPVTIDEVVAVLYRPPAAAEVLEALDHLRRRSLLERGKRGGRFTLHPVVLEYATGWLITGANREITTGRLSLLITYGLCLAQAREYVRQAQQQLIVAPLLGQLQQSLQGNVTIEAQLEQLLDTLRGQSQSAQGYGPANLVALLAALRGNLRGLDLSHLALRGVALHDIAMQDARLSGALLQECIFAETFDVVTTVAISRDGGYWAAASRNGELRVWADSGQTLLRSWPAHIGTVPSLAFSPNGRRLASAGWDTALKLWDVERGVPLWTRWCPGKVQAVAFHPSGRLLASGGDESEVQLWDVERGEIVQTFTGQGSPVTALSWSLDGEQIAVGCTDGRVLI